ncbi:hypothetical protein D1632_02230 [Chryseobacterium nematophagum]|uniref:Uncharacterized protein n=1 Tax=Chryseobacterium nematophagum TaxID=2305228 RepID=A0A3M7LE50_9FLAO|nr:hypothetical protein [Chryseobacterium nematophagum]RMZ60817.1 hypothetical protein D1632_02230 [Chryseobacterium nematophagum]
MVESKEIKDHYFLLLQAVENEMKLNPYILEYYNYLDTQKNAFISPTNVLNKDHLKEFLIGANRYSDEFSFSGDYYHKVKETINNLYEILNG